MRSYPGFALVSLTLALVLLAACAGEQDADDPSVNTLAAGSWPTEAYSSEAGSTKKGLLSSIEAGGLDAETAEKIFADGFHGENFHERSKRPARTESGIVLAEWEESERPLDAAAFRERWNAWLAALGEIQTVEVHTWEIQLRPHPDPGPANRSRIASPSIPFLPNPGPCELSSTNLGPSREYS